MAAPATQGGEKKGSGAPTGRKPGWMSIPGGPKEPNFADFRAKVQAKIAEKTKCFDRLTEIRDELNAARDDGERAIYDKEQKALRGRMSEIDAERRKERERRRATDESMNALKKERAALEDQLRDLTTELGAFKDLEDIENAIERLMVRMETGSSGTLKAEKATLKRLNQLEEAKSLILKIQPLQDAIEEQEEREQELQEEYKQIHDRISSLNKQFETTAGQKAEKDKMVKKTTVDRTVVNKEREDIRNKIAKLNTDIDELRAKFDSDKAAWAKWKEEAIVKHNEIMEKKRQEREIMMRQKELEYQARQKARRAIRRLNPYENEIDCCGNLIRYLEDKINAHHKDKEREALRKRVAAFDPRASAPAGAKLQEIEDEWLFADRTKDKHKAKPQPAKPVAEKSEKQREKYLQHAVDKFRAFELVKVEIPMTTSQVQAAIDELKKKKAEYESHIKEGDAVESDEEANPAEAEVAAE